MVAERAGYRCSFPDCRKLTIGPGRDPSKSIDAGNAAHIYSAALSGRGPRGTGGLSEEELRSSVNAIWLCRHHAGLVDDSQGKDYPADVLHSYKTLHETRVAHELAGIHTPFGWVSKFAVESSPFFCGSVEISLAKLNLVVGGNSVGKTALCEWIAGTANPKYLERWERIVPDGLRRLSARLDYFSPDRHSIEVDFLSAEYPRISLDGERTLVYPSTVCVVFPRPLDFCNQAVPNELEIVANSMGLHRYEVKALCDELPGRSAIFRRAWFEESDEGTFMLVQLRTESGIGTRPLKLLSSSECDRLMMELGIIAADKLSVIGPTLFILDVGCWRIDVDWLQRYAEFFSSPDCRFQTIASTRLTKIGSNDLAWTGWKVIHLEGEPPNSVIAS